MTEMNNKLKIYENKIDSAEYIEITLYFHGGTMYENKNEYGISHLLEHMIFRRLGNYDVDSLSSIFNSMGTELKGKTGIDYISFSLSVLKNDFNKAISLLSKIFEKQNWNNNDLKLEKEIVCHEIELCSNNRYDEKLKQYVYKAEPFLRSPLGNSSSVKRISLKKINDFKEKVLTVSNCSLFITGDIGNKEHNTIISIFEKFDKSNAVNKINCKMEHLFNRTKNDCNLTYSNYEYSDISFCFDIKKEQFPCADIIFCYLSGYTSPISVRLIDKKAFSYELYVDFDKYEDFGILIFNISPKFDRLCEVINDFFEYINNFQESFDNTSYENIKTFLQLNKLKNEKSPYDYNNNVGFSIFNNYYVESNNCLLKEIRNAINEIFKPCNMSVIADFACKKSDVINSLDKFYRV